MDSTAACGYRPDIALWTPLRHGNGGTALGHGSGVRLSDEIPPWDWLILRCFKVIHGLAEGLHE